MKKTQDIFESFVRRKQIRKTIRLFWRLSLRLITFIVFLIIGLWFLLQNDKVQNWLTQKMALYLSDQLKTKVEVNHLHLDFFDKLVLEGVYIEDLKGDTLLYSKTIRADINTNLIALIKRKLEVDALHLESARLFLFRGKEEEFNNLMVLLQNIYPQDSTSTKGADSTKSNKPFFLNAKMLYLNDIQFVKRDEVWGKYLKIHIPRGAVRFNELRIPDKLIDIHSVQLNSPLVKVEESEQFAPDDYDPEAIYAEAVKRNSRVVPDSLQNKFLLQIGAFQLSDGRFELDNFRKSPEKVTPDDILDFQHMRVFDIGINISDFSYTKETYRGKVEKIAFKDLSGFVLENLSATEAIVGNRSVELNDVFLKTPYSALGDTLIFKYRTFYDFLDFNNNVLMETNFNNSKLAIRDILVFAPPLEKNAFFKQNENEVLSVDGQFRGRVNNLRGKDINIKLGKSTSLSGNFSSRNLAVRNEEFLNLKLDRLKTNMKTLRLLVPNFDPPSNFDKLGNLDFSGRFDGFFVDFVADGELQSDLGRATMDMRLDLKSGRSDAKYSGNLALLDFDLAQWSGNKNFGKVTFSSQVMDGVGLTSETANAKLGAKIESFPFKGYTYENLTMEGQINKNLFDGDFSIKDSNIDLAFSGSIEIKDSIPFFDFNARIFKLDLQKLNLSKEDYVVGGNVKLKLNGSNLSNVQGIASATELEIVQNDTIAYLVDSIVAESQIHSEGKKEFTINSEVMKASISGQFDLQKLPDAVLAYLENNYADFARQINLKSSGNAVADHQFEFNIQLIDSKNLLKLIDPKLDTLRRASAFGYFNNVRDSLNLDLEIPELGYDNLNFKDIVIIWEGNDKQSDIDAGISHTTINNQTHFAPLYFIGFINEDTINFGITATNFSKVLDNLNLNGKLYMLDDYMQVTFLPSNLVLLNEKWDIHANNYIRFGKDKIETKNFELTNNEKQILLESKGDKGLVFKLKNLNIDFVNNLWTYDKLVFDGIVEIEAEVSDALKLKDFNGKIKIDTFRVNGDDWGTFLVRARMAELNQPVFSDLSISRGMRNLKASGFYVPPTQATRKTDAKYGPNYFRFDISMANYPLNIAEYFIGNSISNTVGLVDADIKLEGLPALPNISGHATVRDGALTIDYLGTRYFINNQNAVINSSLFDASGAVITDRFGNKAYITGGITHNHLRNFGLDASASSPRFLFLETIKGDNELYYGTGLGSGIVRFTGTFRQTNIEIDAVTGRGTKISMPINYDQTASEDSFIKFVSKNDAKRPGEEFVRDYRGISLNMKLQVTDAAEMQLIFDERQGDIIKGRGNGNIQLNLSRDGEIEMFGDYIISEGEYLFTYQNFVNKNFGVKPGGTIRWSGDPFDARIDLEAYYKALRTSPYSFISNFIQLNPSLETEARRSTDVDLIMKLEGALLQPNIKFDIKFPKLSGELKGFVDNQLRVLQQDENELNRQVFGLIVFGSFLPSGEDAISTSDLAFGTFNTVTEMVSNQLSLLVSEIFSNYIREGGFISGLDLDFSFDLYESRNRIDNISNASSDYELFFRPKVYLWDDRISIDAGVVSGNFNGESYTTADVTFDVKLTEDGRWKFYVYNRPDLDITGRANKTGAGIRYRREFDNLKELFENIKKDKKKTTEKSPQGAPASEN